MAMTKKEQERVRELERELALAKSLRFTDRVLPDVFPPERFTPLKHGFLFNLHRAMTGCGSSVEPACTSSNGHSFGDSEGPSQQGARSLYSTELLAWKALRNEAEMACAKILAGIDEKIKGRSQ